MATRKKTARSAAGRKSGRVSQSRRGSRSVLSSSSYQNYRDTLLEWSEKPAVRYVAGGIGLALLGRFAYSISDKYPELGRFFRENMETIEDKLREFRGIEDQDRITEARH